MNSRLNVKQWAIASVATFVAMSVIEFLVHGVMLSGWYREYTVYWRSQEEVMNQLHWLYLGYALFAAMFSYIYTRGYEGKPGIGEGLRYGVLVGSFIGIPKMFIEHAVFYYPGKMLVAWCIETIVICTILGVIVAMIYKGEKKTA